MFNFDPNFDQLIIRVSNFWCAHRNKHFELMILMYQLQMFWIFRKKITFSIEKAVKNVFEENFVINFELPSIVYENSVQVAFVIQVFSHLIKKLNEKNQKIENSPNLRIEPKSSQTLKEFSKFSWWFRNELDDLKTFSRLVYL